MKRWLQIGWLLGSGFYAWPAHALDQFVLVDVTYTATAQNTSDSHYRVDPSGNTPTNWRSPVDFTGGKAYVHLEVLEKPSSEKTIYNICFDGASNSTCMGYPPAYTMTGTYDFSFAFNTFWQYDSYNWDKGVKDVALILKDNGGTKVQGDAKFYPTKIHVTISVVPAGEMYQPPAAAADGGQSADAGNTANDAGALDAGGNSAGDAAAPDAGDAGRDDASARDAGDAATGKDAGDAATGKDAGDNAASGHDAGTTTSARDAATAPPRTGQQAGSPSTPAAGGGGSLITLTDAGSPQASGSDGGCSVRVARLGMQPVSFVWLLGAALAWLARRRTRMQQSRATSDTTP